MTGTNEANSRSVYTVYRCDRIRRGEAPKNEVVAATGFASAGAAMDRANELRRTDPKYSYVIGGAFL